jgi:hypothetical protein
LYVATLEMRTTFLQMRLFIDDLIMSGTSFILNGKEWGEGKIERERKKKNEQVESERQSVVLRVAAWVMNLTVGQAIYEGYRERDNP